MPAEASGRVIKKRLLAEDPRWGSTTSDTAVSDYSRTLYIFLHVWSDGRGRVGENVELLRTKFFPLLLEQHPPKKITKALRELEAHGLIFRYKVRGSAYLQLVSFHDDNTLRSDRLTVSEFPCPPVKKFSEALEHYAPWLSLQHDELRWLRGEVAGCADPECYCRAAPIQTTEQLKADMYAKAGKEPPKKPRKRGKSGHAKAGHGKTRHDVTNHDGRDVTRHVKAGHDMTGHDVSAGLGIGLGLDGDKCVRGVDELKTEIGKYLSVDETDRILAEHINEHGSLDAASRALDDFLDHLRGSGEGGRKKIDSPAAILKGYLCKGWKAAPREKGPPVDAGFNAFLRTAQALNLKEIVRSEDGKKFRVEMAGDTLYAIEGDDTIVIGDRETLFKGFKPVVMEAEGRRLEAGEEKIISEFLKEWNNGLP